MCYGKNLIEEHEGRRPELHLVQGIWHVGVGHNIDPHRGGTQLCEKAIEAQFEHDLQTAKRDAVAWLDNKIVGLDRIRYAVVLDLAFRLGRTRLLGFIETGKAIRVRDWAKTALEMRDSDQWRRERKDGHIRMERLAQMMETGKEVQRENVEYGRNQTKTETEAIRS